MAVLERNINLTKIKVLVERSLKNKTLILGQNSLHPCRRTAVHHSLAIVVLRWLHRLLRQYLNVRPIRGLNYFLYNIF